jgi:Lon protease-like protein
MAASAVCTISCSLCCDNANEDPRLNEIPLFPLNIVLFPNGPLPLRIFETRYVDMVRRCMREGSGFGVVLIREGRESQGPAEICDVGTLAKIVDFDQLPDGLLGLTCVGERRFRIRSRRRQADGLNLGEVDWLEPEPVVKLPVAHARLAELLASVLPQLGDIYAGIAMQLDDAAWVGHRLAEILPIALTDKQFCLELDDPLRRLDVLAPMIQIVAADEDEDEEGAGGEEEGGEGGEPKVDH